VSTPGQIETEVETALVPGERLRLAREALKLSQQDVAERIRINVDKVAALEADEIARVGAPVFAVGYIRAYARIVGLPADELIPKFAGLGHLDARPPMLASAAGDGGLARLSAGRASAFSRKNGRRRRRPLRLVGSVLLILAIVAVVLWMVMSGNLRLAEAPQESVVHKPSPQKSMTQPALPEPSPETPPEKNVGTEAQTLAIPDQGEYKPAPDTVATDEDFSLELVEPSAQAASPADEQAGSEDTMTVDSRAELSLYFQADSWVEIHDARGERLIHQLVRAGQSHTLYGVAPFAVVLGYVPGVSLLLDGEAVDLGKYQGRRLARFSVGGEMTNENL